MSQGWCFGTLRSSLEKRKKGGKIVPDWLELVLRWSLLVLAGVFGLFLLLLKEMFDCFDSFRDWLAKKCCKEKKITSLPASSATSKTAELNRPRDKKTHTAG